MHHLTLSIRTVTILFLLGLGLAPAAVLAQEGQPATAATETPPSAASTTDYSDAPEAGDKDDGGDDIWKQFAPHFEVRLRPEWATSNNGAETNDFNTFLRVRLGLTWTPADNVSATVILQDTQKFEVASSGSGTTGGNATTGLTFNTDLYLGFIKWTPVDGVMLQAGRQEISYDTQRLLGALDWVDHGRQFDAFRVRIGDPAHSHNKFSMDLFWTPLSFDDGFGASRFDKHTRQLAGLHATLPFLENHKFSAYLYYLNNRASAGVPDHLFTLGSFFASTAKEGLIYDAELALQVSKTNAVDGEGFAWAGHLGFGYIAGELKLAGEVNAASGDVAGGATVESFNNLFPTNHAKYGYIDRQNWSNTFNFAVRAWYTLKPGDGAPWIAELSVWFFFPLRYTGGNDSYAGVFAAGARGMKAFEVDFLLKHKFNKLISTAFGASVWAPGAALRAGNVKGTDLYLYALIGLKI